jgi:hypothetical protein
MLAASISHFDPEPTFAEGLTGKPRSPGGHDPNTIQAPDLPNGFLRG